MLRSVLRASQICACRRMLPLPLPLVRLMICLLLGYLKSLLSVLKYVSTVLDNVASGQLQRNGDSAERLWKLLWQTGNTPWMHKDRDQVPQYQYHGDWRCLFISSPCFTVADLLTFREAWLRLSMQYHPDLNQDDEKAAQRFLEIKEAYTGERSTCWTYFKGRHLLQHAYFFIEVNCIELQNLSTTRSEKCTMTR